MVRLARQLPLNEKKNLIRKYMVVGVGWWTCFENPEDKGQAEWEACDD